jgi:hypothetical protein
MEAFEAGRAQGKREASSEVRAKLEGFIYSIDALDICGAAAEIGSSTLRENEVPPQRISSDTPAHHQMIAERGHYAIGRATPGTVKPALASIIATSSVGVTTETIIARTGFKENSVRGTLHSLRTEGKIEKKGNLWFPASASQQGL